MTHADNTTVAIAAERSIDRNCISTAADDSGLPDSILLESWVRDHNHEALATLMRRYDPLVRKVCGNRCRSVADRDDAYQTTFFYLADRAHTIRHPERLPGWLHRVAQRAALAVLRERLHDAMPDDVPDSAVQKALADVSQRHEALILDEALAEIPERYRAVLVLKHMQGDSVGKIADRLECTEGTVRGRLQRGRALLSRILRRRGLVPAVVIGGAMQSNIALAGSPLHEPSEITSEFLNQFAAGQVSASPPVPLHTVSSLLKGSIAMSRFYLVASSGVLVLAAVGMSSLGMADSDAGNAVVLVQGSAGSSGAENPVNAPASSDASEQSVDSSSAPKQSRRGDMGMGGGMGMGMGMGGMGGMDDEMDMEMGMGMGGMMGSMMMGESGPVSLSAQWSRFLDKPISFGITDQSAGDLIRNLGEFLGPEAPVGISVNERALELSASDLNQKLKYRTQARPVRLILKDLLSPLNLRAVPTDDGLEITADMVRLTRQGIAADQWLDVDADFAKVVEDALSTKTSATFIETSLVDAVQTLQEEHKLPFVIDRTALEEIGLTADTPVSLELNNVSLGSLLFLMLKDLDLTFTPQNEVLQITSTEAAETALSRRIYWLEGIIPTTSKIFEVVRAIEGSIDPDTWEELGGPSTITATDHGGRPAIMVAATYVTHRKIERYLKTIRENSFDDIQFVPEQGVSLERPVRKDGGGMGGGGMF